MTIEPRTSISFSDLGLGRSLLKALDEAGYKHPTPIQEKAIPILLKQKDLLGTAQTGTGKTAAFLLPLLESLLSGSAQKLPFVALILAPTRELAIQIHENFEQYAKHTKIKASVIFGGVNQKRQEHDLAKKPEVLIATPGRLLDLIQQKIISLRQVHTFVLDEADRMLDMGFLPDVKRIVREIPIQRQTALFSATMPSEILSLAKTILNQPQQVSVAPVSSVAQSIEEFVYFTPQNKKQLLLVHLLQKIDMPRTIVFTRTKHGANRIVQTLEKENIPSAAIHSNKSQNARQRALKEFKDGKLHVLVASDIASRGIDVDDISHVVNFDLPNIPETYVHRIGRTGRASAAGTAFSFCSSEERSYLRQIERVTKKTITVVKDHPFTETTVLQSPSESKPQAQRPFHQNAQNNQKKNQSFNKGKKTFGKQSQTRRPK